MICRRAMYFGPPALALWLHSLWSEFEWPANPTLMRQEPILSKRLDLTSVPEPAFRPPATSDRLLLLALMIVALSALVATTQGWLPFSRGSDAPAVRSTHSRASPPPIQLPQVGPIAIEPEASRPRTQQITKCISLAGKAAYQDGACAAGSNAVSVTVQPDGNLADGMSAGARAASAQENSVIAQRQAEYERAVALNTSADSPEAVCAGLARAILALDAEARQPLPAREQDRIRAERRGVRDRQFALRC